MIKQRSIFHSDLTFLPDLILEDDPHIIAFTKFIPLFEWSDHSILVLRLQLSIPTLSRVTKRVKIIDYDALRTKVQNIVHPDVETMWSAFTSKLSQQLESCSTCRPKVVIQFRLWIDQSALHMRKTRKRLSDLLRKSEFVSILASSKMVKSSSSIYKICSDFQSHLFLSYQSFQAFTFANWLDYVEFPPEVVKEYLSSLDLISAPGGDWISALLLKNCASSLSLSLSMIFTKSFTKHTLLECWREALVRPVFKKDICWRYSFSWSLYQAPLVGRNHLASRSPNTFKFTAMLH